MPLLKISGVLLFAALTLPATAQTPHIRPATHASAPVEPTGPIAVIDTSAGRLTCRLYTKQAPATTANFIGLADGSKDGTSPATSPLTHGKPFYDDAPLFGVTNGVAAGDLPGTGKTAGAPLPAEKTGLDFERPGRLVMSAVPRVPGSPKDAPAQISSSIFRILVHSDAETAKTGAVVFGQCDAASIALATSISHTLLSSENHPDVPVVVRHITILREGEPLPPAPPTLSQIQQQPIYPPTPLIPSPEPTGPTAVIDTTMGKLTCRLFSNEAPIGVANFTGLANGTKGWTNPTTHAPAHGRFYDGLTFRRVIPDFMIQNADIPGDPRGGGEIGIKFANEIVPGLTFDRPGRLAYANAGPGTNSSQFFITEHPVSRLDGNFTIFGQCDDASVKVVEAIARVSRDSHNKPDTPVVIRSVHITQ